MKIMLYKKLTTASLMTVKHFLITLIVVAERFNEGGGLRSFLIVETT